MTTSHNPQAAPKGHISAKTLQAVVDVTRKDVQNIEFAIASAKKAGAPTAHWEERLRQTKLILSVALKEISEFTEQASYA